MFLNFGTSNLQKFHFWLYFFYFGTEWDVSLKFDVCLYTAFLFIRKNWESNMVDRNNKTSVKDLTLIFNFRFRLYFFYFGTEWDITLKFDVCLYMVFLFVRKNWESNMVDRNNKTSVKGLTLIFNFPRNFLPKKKSVSKGWKISMKK